MTTNPREELARIIDEHEWSRHHGGSRGEQIADILIEHGWRKVDPDAETCTEWAIDHGKYGIGAVWDEDSARARVEHYRRYGAAARLVSRTVHVGPWREGES